MTEQAFQAGSDGPVQDSRALVVPEQEAALIAEAIDWGKVQEMAQRIPGLAPSYAAYINDESRRRAFHVWCASPVRAFAYDALVIAAVQIESQQPRYLDLPAVLAGLANDADFVAARPVGRLLYRMAMYEVIETALDEAKVAEAVKQYGRKAVEQALEDWDRETYQHVYAPRRLEQREVFSLIDAMIRVPDRRLAVLVSLASRVGQAVGFLSGLSVAQKEEAQKGMVILAGLVAPLLVASPAVPRRSALPRSRKRR